LDRLAELALIPLGCAAVTDIFTVLLSAAALAVAIAAAAIARRNANAADDSAVSARISAEAAKESAGHAKSSAVSAAVVARTELERNHEMYRPAQPAEPHFQIEVNERTQHENLVFEFTPARTYRVSGDALNADGNGRTPLSVNLLVRAGEKVRINFDELRPVRQDTTFKALHLRFWPPSEVDDVEQWTCPCNRPVASHEAAHWEWSVPVVQPPRNEVIISTAQFYR
jgi:hypothetical protein